MILRIKVLGYAVYKKKQLIIFHLISLFRTDLSFEIKLHNNHILKTHTLSNQHL